MPNKHWSVSIQRTVTQWGTDFTEHWTYKQEDEDRFYKQRVVGPNGEVCRRRLDVDAAPPEIRDRFKSKFQIASDSA